MFDVGDEVYSKKFGEGVVICVDDNDMYLYPIQVQWKNSSKRDIFTPEGRYNIHLNDPDTDICILKVGAFKVGDHVVSKHFGEGVVTRIADPLQYEYPVEVHWTGACPGSFNASEYFAKDGKFNHRYPQPEFDIIKKEDEDKMGQIVGSVNHNIQDGVAPWGKFFEGKKDEKMMGVDDKIFHDPIHDLKQKKDEGTVERMKDTLNKKVEDAVNPSHYRVEGLPEAIDIINHLMHHEQYEGFLWGNILKYAYRYGRKGDKAETAGKIEWYANHLKELAEVMENDSEGTHGVGKEE